MPFSTLLQALTNRQIVITPTNRLQRELLWLYTQQQSKGICPKPLCFSYESFLQDWYDQLCFTNAHKSHPKLLSHFSFSILFQSIYEKEIGRSIPFHELKTALSTLKNCFLMNQFPQISDVQYQPAFEQFADTINQINNILKQHHAITPLDLSGYLSQQAYPRTSPKIIWACFDYFHPAQLALQKTLELQGMKQEFFDFEAPKIIHSHFSSTHDNLLSEQAVIINWLKHQQSLDKKRIGLVLPDLSQCKEQLYAVLKQHFDEKMLHFSLGQSIYEFPIIKHALGILQLAPEQLLSKEECRLLLLTPFRNAYQSEHVKAQHLLLTHRLFQEPLIPYHDFLALCQKKLPELYQQLLSINAYANAASPTDILTILSKRLNAFGFPANMGLNDENHQILNKFYQKLELLSEASEWIDNWSVTEALKTLKHWCQEEIYQPPQNYHGIHIMGWLESSGFCGDALWIGHFHSSIVPSQIQYSNLLPISWQKSHQFPRTNAELEYQMARKMLNRLFGAHQNHEVIISYSKWINDEPNWPSSIFPSLPEYQPVTCTPNHIEPELIENDFIYPVQPSEKIKGGSQLLATHAQCPFQAFAKYRLQTQYSIEETTGLNARERGQLIHQILQSIWQELQNQESLLKLTPETEAGLINKHIKKALESLERPYSLADVVLEIEYEQLYEKIVHALAFDKSREPFTIDGLEQVIQLDINGFHFDLRYDRQDQLSNGQKCLIDYKTSIPSPLPWNQDRPIHPQILMYALADAKITTLLFMEIGLKETNVAGFSAEKSSIKSIKSSSKSWTEMQQQWYQTMQQYILEIQNGYCEPKPYNPELCKKCLQRDICRQT